MMQAEQIEIARFLKQYVPFSSLPDEVVNQLACDIEISYYRSGSDIFSFGDEIHDLCIIRSGAVEILRRNGDLYNRLSEGELFGQLGLLMNNRIRLPAKAIEDTLIYFIPESWFIRLCEEYEPFAYFVEIDDNRLHQAVNNPSVSNNLMVSKVTALISREPVTITTDASIRDAAVKMTENGVSSLLVMNTEAARASDQHNPLSGIITDRDLRTRVVAGGLSFDTPVAEVMTTELITLDADAYAFEAMLEMLRFNLHHIPVLKEGLPVGVLASSDIVRLESQNSLYVVGRIMRQQTVKQLSEMASEVNASFSRMVREDANSHMIGAAMSVIGRTFTQRLVQLAEAELGSPPLPYCFMTLGSMARDEQLLNSDQDNALILDNSYDPAIHGEYFEKLSEFICDGLAACNYRYCDGDIMATNPRWRKTRKQWQELFRDWIDNPDPQALLNCSIFFDLSGVAGQTEWAQQLSDQVVSMSGKSPSFLGCIARNALNRTPPLGFFKGFVMEKDGHHRNSINLKRRGTAPLSDLIRVHALAVGSSAQNSLERLNDVINAGVLPEGKGEELRDAMEFISMVRIRHQARDVDEGIEPDNNIEPDQLSDFERRNLKDAFQVLSNSQRFLKFRYPYSRK